MRNTTDDNMHWEEIIRAMLERLGAERLAELIDYVLEDEGMMRMDEPPPPLGTIH